MKRFSVLAKLTVTPVRVALYAALVFLVVLFVILFTVFRDSIDDRTLDRFLRTFQLSDRTGAAATLLIDSHPQNQYGLYKSRLAVLSPERLVLYDKAGVESASAVIRMENPVLRTAGNTALVFDRGGGSCVVAREKEVEAVYEDEMIYTAVLTEGDCYAVAAYRSGYRGVVSVYDSSHYKRMEWYSAESGFIQDIAINKDASLLAVAAVRQEKDQLVSRLTFLKTNKSEPVATVDIPDRLVVALYMMRDNLCVLLEDEVRFYKPGGDLIATHDLEGRFFLDVRVSDDLCAIRAGRQASEYHSVLTLLDRSGKRIGDIALEDVPVDAMHVAGPYAGILQNGALSLYNAKAELCFFEENHSDSKTFRVMPDGSVLLIGQDRAQWVR